MAPQSTNRLYQPLCILQGKWGCTVCNDQFTESPASHIVGNRHRTNNDLLLWSCRDCATSALQISQSLDEATERYQQITQVFQPTDHFLDVSPHTLLQPWSCKTCNIITVEPQELHEDNKLHRANLAKPLYCKACNVIINVETKACHERGKKHKENIRAGEYLSMAGGFGYLESTNTGNPKETTVASLTHDSWTSPIHPVDSWTCTDCNITVPEWFQKIHNRGEQHRKNKRKKPSWMCQICNFTCTLSARGSHERTKKHLNNLKNLAKSKKFLVALLQAPSHSYDPIIGIPPNLNIQSSTVQRHKILRLIPPEKKSKRSSKPLSLSLNTQQFIKTSNPIDHPGPHRYYQSKPGAIRRQNTSTCSVCGIADSTEYSRLKQPQCTSCHIQERDSIILEEEWLSYWELPEPDYSASVEKREHELRKVGPSLFIGPHTYAVRQLLVHQLARKKALSRHHFSRTYANPAWNPWRDSSRSEEKEIGGRHEVLACRDKKYNFPPECFDDDSEERIVGGIVKINMKDIARRPREKELKTPNPGSNKGNRQERSGTGGRASKAIIGTQKHLSKVSRGHHIETDNTSSRGWSNEEHVPIAFEGQENECWLCRFKQIQGENSKVEGCSYPDEKTYTGEWRCSTCEVSLCVSPSRNCFVEFHRM